MKIAPSVLSLDYASFKEQVGELNKGTDILHFDVMDGNFVPNISFGPDILKAFRKSTDSFLDVHLMIADPAFYTPSFVKAGADGITFHYEACKDDEDVLRVINVVRDNYVKVGISIKPNTPVSAIEPFLSLVDLVLVMSVEPGFGGQSFMPSAVDKIAELADLRSNNGYSYLIEVDGGINNETAVPCIDKGCDILVAGSYVFKGDICSKIESLKQ